MQTADNVAHFQQVAPYDFPDLQFTNSILTAVSSIANASHSITFDHCATNSSSSGFYQSAAAGNFYLASSSTNRGAGTAMINSDLLAALKQKTTYPPVIYSNITVSTNLTLAPQAQRETGTAPDIGFGYDPIDFITHLVSVTNCSLTLAPGTAVACYNGTGIWPQEGSSITCIGTPLAPIWFTRYQSVQEQAISLGGSDPSQGSSVTPYHTGTPAPTGVFRFTRFSCPANGGVHFYDGAYSFGALLLQDSEIWGGANRLTGAGSNTVTALQNNLFNRGTFLASSTVTNSLSMSNNLFWSVAGFTVKPANSNLWAAYNNEFDSCSWGFSQGSVVASGYNAYWNCNKHLTPTNTSDITLTNAIAYQSGPLGALYQTNTSQLINAGSCTADTCGLYQYTVITNLASGLEMRETNSIVDIGFHYVATDSNGNPIDTDGDGVANYAEDLNGNGSYDSSAGETDWLAYNSPNGLAAGSGLQVFTPLK